MQQSLAVAAFAATQLVTGCATQTRYPEPNPAAPGPAGFYQTQAQCEAEVRRQQALAAEQQAKILNGSATPPTPTMRIDNASPSTPPTPTMRIDNTAAKPNIAKPAMTIADCAKQTRATREENDRSSSSSGGTHTRSDSHGGYRPSYDRPSYDRPSPVYRPPPQAQPQPQVQPQPDKNPAPQSVTNAPPSRPSGHEATGTVGGRSDSSGSGSSYGGFGSSYKSTGSGGK